MMNKYKYNLKTILYFGLLLLLTSCAGSFYSFSGASISPDIKTISISYFPNKSNTVKSDISSMFTEKLKDYFTSKTNLDLVQNDGHLSFNGEIISYEIKPIAIQANETAKQNRITIKIKVGFINHIDNKKNFQSTFSRYKDIDANDDLTSIEESINEEILDDLVEDVFNRAIVNW